MLEYDRVGGLDPRQPHLGHSHACASYEQSAIRHTFSIKYDSCARSACQILSSVGAVRPIASVKILNKGIRLSMRLLLLSIAATVVFAQTPPASGAPSSLDFQFFKTRVQPIFLAKR